jgi:hydrogenase maturation protein HypF
VLAVGAELKSTVAVARDTMVVASHHIGDLEHLATYRSFVQAIDHLRHLYDVVPEVIAHDLHPEYVSTKFALELDWPTVAVQHHHAHVAACMVDHGRMERVLAMAFDGLGYGPDGTMWGGEFLVADLTQAERVAHLLPVTMPGGVAAIREPRRMAVAWGIASDDLIAQVPGPVTTSMGRLFDAVASLLLRRARASYEAQAAIELEAMARSVDRSQAPTYDGTVARGPVLDPTELLAALVADHRRGVPPAVIAAGFHEAIGRSSAALAIDLAFAHGIDAVALTGGVFQNVRLTDIVSEAIEGAGLRALVHERIPANDGGISIGQAAIAALS